MQFSLENKYYVKHNFNTKTKVVPITSVMVEDMFVQTITD